MITSKYDLSVTVIITYVKIICDIQVLVLSQEPSKTQKYTNYHCTFQPTF
jgi:hypothetical protein